MKKVRKKVSLYSIILYIFGLLLLAFAVWTTIKNYDYVKNALDAGMPVKGYEYEIANYMISGSGIYYAAGLGLIGIGIAIQKITNAVVPVLRAMREQDNNAQTTAAQTYDYSPYYDPDADYGAVEEPVQDAAAQTAEAVEQTAYDAAEYTGQAADQAADQAAEAVEKTEEAADTFIEQ
ncbi:MAG: hypothetical protein IKS19_04820 [Clostridia bacterium]|nr:hypothetical protein [Clostridia bacterium]